VKIPWWTFLRVSARWELDRLLRLWRGEAAEAPESEFAPEPEPEAPVRTPLPAADATEAGPAYTIPEECRLRVLAEWLRVASDGTQTLAEDLAGQLRSALPGMRDHEIAKVLLALEPVLEQVARDQHDAYAAMQAIWDSVLGGTAVLAEFDLALAERGDW
jgi:hypothetical protein